MVEKLFQTMVLENAHRYIVANSIIIDNSRDQTTEEKTVLPFFVPWV